MARSIWKGPFVDMTLIKKLWLSLTNYNTSLTTYYLKTVNHYSITNQFRLYQVS